MRSLREIAWVGVMTCLAIQGCLANQTNDTPDCNGGAPYRLETRWYCIYTGAIIIEGFLCPESIPYGFFFDGQEMGLGQGSGQVALCSPSETPPPGGWRDVFDKWRDGGGQPNPWPNDATGDSEVVDDSSGPDTRDPVTDTASDGDTSEPEPDVLVDVGPGEPCEQGLSAGTCWETSQCPTSWTCGGQTTDCTSCESCPGATLGECTASQDAIALVWDGALRVAVWSVLSFYTVVPCPGFLIETAPAAGGPWTAGPQEDGCTADVPALYASPLARVAPTVDSSLWTRVRATLRTGCSSSDPSQCAGSVELLSEPLAPLP
jgi:hypothetical protein